MKTIILSILFATISVVHLQAENLANKSMDSLKTELKKVKEDSSKIIILNRLSVLYGKVNPTEALKYGRQALKLAKKTNNKTEKARAYNNIGYLYLSKADYVRSLDNFYKALKIYEEIDPKKELSGVYNNLGNAYILNKNYKKALRYYIKVLLLNSKDKKDATTALTLNNIGDVYLQMKEYKKALNYFYRALDVNMKLKSNKDIGLNQTNIGICLINLKNYSKGIEAINKSNTICDNNFYTIYNSFELGRAHYLMAMEYNKKSKKMLLNKSIDYLDNALIGFQKERSLLYEQECYLYLSKANKELEKYELALGDFEKYTQIKDSIFSEDNKHKIANLETQRELDLRDKKIEIQNLKINSEARKVYSLIAIALTVAVFMTLFLWMYLSKRKTNRLLNEKNKIISAANHQKDKFFSIIAHDLRDPFNGFLGLTELLAEDLDTMSPDEIKFAAVNMRSSATNLFRLLENLLEWSRMEQGLISFTPQENNLQTVVSECIVPLNANANTKEIKIYNNIPENTIAYADKNSLQAVIRNVLSNAVKFTSMGGEITIKAEEDENNTTISISDSGIGMNAEMVKNLFRLDVKTNRTGTNDEPSTGLGLILCKEFVEKHRGEIWVESKEGKGTIFYFNFPKLVL